MVKTLCRHIQTHVDADMSAWEHCLMGTKVSRYFLKLNLLLCTNNESMVNGEIVGVSDKTVSSFKHFANTYRRWTVTA